MEIDPNTDFREKYAPLVHVLTNESDFDFLAGESGYQSGMAESFRGMRREAIRGYLVELAADFELLHDTLLPSAISDARLAVLLVEARREWRRTHRSIRFRLFLDGFIPNPTPHRGIGLLVRRIVLWLLPRPAGAVEFLSKMEQLGRMAASV